MSDNVIKSTDLNAVEKKTAKKATPKKEAVAKKSSAAPNGVKDGFKIVVFESGASYTSNGIRFTRDNNIQEVPEADADILLGLDNFRLPNQFEIEDYFNSKED